MAVVPESDGSGSEPRAFIVSLDGTPVDTANALIADTLPDVFLDDIDLGAPDGLNTFITSLIRRRYQTSLERSEILRFVTQNRDILERTHLLDTLAKAADATVDDPEGRGFLNDTIEQLKHQTGASFRRV